MQMTSTLISSNPQDLNPSSLGTLDIHRCQDLINLFNCTFANHYNTVLIKGDHEPIYIPAASTEQSHQVVFAHGYFASALHEIAHWCIAVEKRRLLEDYGYWYCPDGRDSEQQARFEQVEIKPQAIEWAFSLAANKCFKVSTDNLNGAEVDHIGFQLKVSQQAKFYLENGFPVRAAQFIQVLQSFYKTKKLSEEMFDEL